MSIDSAGAAMLPVLYAALDRVGGDESDLVDLMFLAPFTDGRQPFLKSDSFSAAKDGADPVPPGGRMLRLVAGDGQRTVLFEGVGWTAICRVFKTGGGNASVVAESEDLADEVLAGVVKAAADDAAPSQTQVPIGFWYMTNCGPDREVRKIEAQSWAEISGNYADTARSGLERLMAMTAPDGLGRLLLFNGPPGTGKTTALRTLARQWRDWCQVDYVLDPERMFSDSSYLMRAAMGEDGDENGRRWRMLLLEDCDELIRAEAKAKSGQALSRLLNLTDGLLGQGREILVAVTTNEELATLHPAVVRPGRCLAQIEIGPLPAPEAAQWRVRNGRPPVEGGGAATLAELLLRS